MTMVPFNGDPSLALKWLQNKAPNIQSLITQKGEWYDSNSDKFWSDWTSNVFDIRNANIFGLAVWCIILGLPQTPFNFAPLAAQWAFGPKRQNFIANAANPPPQNPNLLGGNFYGSNQTSITSLREIRFALLLRYVALTHGGRIAEINRMLKYIFNGDVPWDAPNGLYAFVTDLTASTGVPPTNVVVTLQDWAGTNVLSPVSRTNLSPGLPNAAWVAVNSVKTTGVVDLQGNNNAVTIADTASNTFHGTMVNNLAIGQNSQNVASVFVKARTARYATLFLDNGNGNGVFATFDLTGGTVTGSGSNGQVSNQSQGMEQLANGWYRVYVTATLGPLDTSARLSLLNSNTPNPGWYSPYVGSGLSFDAFFSQLEVGSVPGDYIFTTNAPASSTDYTLDTAGNVTIVFAPQTGAKLTYSGQFGQGTANNLLFGTGNGTTKTFALTNPVRTGGPTSGPFKVEYRFGPALNLSAQFISLLNADFDILPSFAGSKVTAIQGP